MSAHSRPARDDGFSLIEVVVAMSLLMVGLLGLAQVFYFGLAIVGTSSAQLIAREKAREAIESVHTARDTRVITWAADPQRRQPPGTACAAWARQPRRRQRRRQFTTDEQHAARGWPRRPGRAPTTTPARR